MSNIVLAAREIRKTYRNNSKAVKALDGISLEVKANSSLAILGPSGAGKSTFLHVLGGLDKPTSGRVELGGVNLYKLGDRERAAIRNKRIGFVFQFYHLLPDFTALENVMLPVSIGGAAKGSSSGDVCAAERAMSALHSVGLKDRIAHAPSELSGGESQRVAIARALVNEPEVLLCDEPTGNLDSKTSQSIYELLFSLQSQRKMALVIVTHDEKMASSVRETVHIRDGRIV